MKFIASKLTACYRASAAMLRVDTLQKSVTEMRTDYKHLLTELKALENKSARGEEMIEVRDRVARLEVGATDIAEQNTTTRTNVSDLARRVCCDDIEGIITQSKQVARVVINS
jgi:predicted nuclease with TOPRIM domain